MPLDQNMADGKWILYCSERDLPKSIPKITAGKKPVNKELAKRFPCNLSIKEYKPFVCTQNCSIISTKNRFPDTRVNTTPEGRKEWLLSYQRLVTKPRFPRMSFKTEKQDGGRRGKWRFEGIYKVLTVIQAFQPLKTMKSFDHFL